MKSLPILILITTMACSPAALADFPFDAGKLGRMQGILDACRQATPRDASDYLLQMKSLIGDATKAMVDEATRTQEYQAAYQAVRSELSGMSQADLAAACTSYLATVK